MLDVTAQYAQFCLQCILALHLMRLVFLAVLISLNSILILDAKKSQHLIHGISVDELSHEKALFRSRHRVDYNNKRGVAIQRPLFHTTIKCDRRSDKYAI